MRVWNIPEQRVVDWADVHEMVTATAFAPDGRRAVVGTMKGRCRFYQCEPSFKLEYQAQIGARARPNVATLSLNPRNLNKLRKRHAARGRRHDEEALPLLPVRAQLQAGVPGADRCARPAHRRLPVAPCT